MWVNMLRLSCSHCLAKPKSHSFTRPGRLPSSSVLSSFRSLRVKHHSWEAITIAGYHWGTLRHQGITRGVWQTPHDFLHDGGKCRVRHQR